MISISGIKYQKELEKMPVFTKKQAEVLIGKSGKNLDKKLAQLKRMNYLLPIKNGLYTTAGFYDAGDKGKFKEFLANSLRTPSYISLEYILNKEGLIPEAVFAVTSITLKSSRDFITPFDSFIYKNLKPKLFTGFTKEDWGGKAIHRAAKAKALFDWLYLKKLKNLKQELTVDLRINWTEFTKQDFEEFKIYVKISTSKKMAKIVKIMENIL